MSKTKLMKNVQDAMLVFKVAFAGLVEAVQSNSNVNNALATTRLAMTRYDDSIDAVEVWAAPSIWDRFKSKVLLKKYRESAAGTLIAARKVVTGGAPHPRAEARRTADQMSMWR